MVVIGIAGGVASGKSLVTNQLSELGAKVLDVDGLAHEVLLEPLVKSAIRDRWGSAVFDDADNVDRTSLAGIVFAPHPGGPQELEHLERITHPRIGERLRDWIRQLRDEGDVQVAVLDAAVMFKAGWHKACDRILFVEASGEQRWARARQRGWTEAEFRSREAAQEALDMKRQQADTVIDNSGTKEQTFEQVKRFWTS